MRIFRDYPHFSSKLRMNTVIKRVGSGWFIPTPDPTFVPTSDPTQAAFRRMTL